MEIEGGNFFLAADAFGHKFSFRIHHKFTSYKTVCGFLLTLVLMIALVPFALYKYKVMLNFEDSTIIKIHNPEYYNETYELSASHHKFDVAFALVGWGDSAFEGDISMYGELKAFYKSWGNEGDPPGTTYYEIETRPCTADEIGLGLDKSLSRFYPPRSDSVDYVRDYSDIMQCIDKDVVLRGNY